MLLDSTCISVTNTWTVDSGGRNTVGKAYEWLRNELAQNLHWAKVIWSKKNMHKASFITWLAA